MIAGADFFTTEVWTWRGLLTYYTVLVIDLASRRVHIVGSTPHPNELFMRQVSRTLTADEGVLVGHRVLICDRDQKWSAPVRERLGEAAIRVVQTPYQAPNANAYAERFVRSIKEECLIRMIPTTRPSLRIELRPEFAGPDKNQGAPRACVYGSVPVGKFSHTPAIVALMALSDGERRNACSACSRSEQALDFVGNWGLRALES